MLEAYLRGLLKTKYRYGIRSILREDTILQALEREKSAALGLQRLALETSFAPTYSRDGVQKMWKVFSDSWPRYYDWAHRMPYSGPAAIEATKEAKAMALLYDALEKSGMFDHIAQQTD